MKNSFKKLVSLVAVLTMAIALVAVPNVSAKADEAPMTGGPSHLNTYWFDATLIYCFAQEGKAVGDLAYGGTPTTYDWWSSIVLKQNANGQYEVTAVDIIDGVGGSTIHEKVIGEGELVIIFHATDTDAKYANDLAFLKSLQVGDLLYCSCAYASIADGSVLPVFTKATNEGILNLGNAVDANGEKISVFVTDDANATLSSVTASSDHPDLPYWFSFVAEKDADGAYVVTAVDLVQDDGVNGCKDVKLGEGKILVAWHDYATDKSSAAFFVSTVAEGQKYYLVGDVVDGDLSGVYLTTEKPADDGNTDAGTGSDEEIKDTGDNFVPMFVVLFAGLAMVTVATIARKKNA